MANLLLQSGKDLNTHKTNYQCGFKRGRKCVTHGLVGEKKVNTLKIWDKKKNGCEWMDSEDQDNICLPL